MTRATVAALLLGALTCGTAMAQEDPDVTAVPNAPDFSEVKSQPHVDALAARGELVPVLLFPAEVGGAAIPPNTVYLPPEAAAAKAQVDQTIVRFVEEGVLNQMNVAPEYRGDSFVPARIVIEAWHTERDGGFNPVIEVW